MKVMRVSWNLTKTIDHLIGKSKDWLSDYYDSKLWEKSSSPNRFAQSKFDSLKYSSIENWPSKSRSSRSRSKSLEWKHSAIKTLQN